MSPTFHITEPRIYPATMPCEITLPSPSLYLTEEYVSPILNHKLLNPIPSLISAHIFHFPSATMPNILSLPRELRDEIYKWGLLDTLASAKDRRLQHDRKRVSRSPKSFSRDLAADPKIGYHEGEDAVRYPEHTSLPPTHSLLHTSRQLRAELLDSIKRLGPVKYKIDLTDRNDKNALYPTWISVPVFARHIDILEVQLRVRPGQTSSICSTPDDEGRECDGDTFSGGIALLERFLERGIYFLSKKKAQRITVGLLDIQVDSLPDVEEDRAIKVIDTIADSAESWMLGTRQNGVGDDEKEKEERHFRFLASRIERLRLSFQGILRREWDLQTMIKRRDAPPEDYVDSNGVGYCGVCDRTHITCSCWGNHPDDW